MRKKKKEEKSCQDDIMKCNSMYCYPTAKPSHDIIGAMAIEQLFFLWGHLLQEQEH